MNILLWLAYKGTNYSGFQVQPNGVTVCAVVQDAMQSVFGTRPDVKGCSRTDAGVHARRFALNFHYDGRIPVQRIPLALNARLPMDVRALAAQQVPDDFHARYAAHAKTYHYRLRCSAVDDPFDYETCHRVNGPLDLAAMQAAAAHFVGRHDFLALCASGSSAAAHGDTVRTITACTVQQDGELYTLSVTADGYLYNMVRILAGTVLAFARALGEYGATSMIAGYTPGKTATIATTVYQLWRTNDELGAMRWVLVDIAISAVVLLAVNLLEKKQKAGGRK